MRTRVVIQSRLSSSRLPGKALMTVGGMPLIELVARRASRTGFGVVVATSVESYDDRIAAQLEPTGIRVIRGSLDDVLSRFLTATSDMDDRDRVVRLTGDNPVTDAALVQELMDAMDESGREYGRVDIDVVPEGLGVEVFSVGMLRRAGREATDAYDREHVTPWIRRHTDELLFAPQRNPGYPAVYRATVDCLHDFTRVARLFDGFADPVDVHWADLMDSLVGQVKSLGPIAKEVPKASRRLTSLILSVTNIGLSESDATRPGWGIREVFTRAVEAGISDVISTPEDAPIVAAGLLPMLNKRMGVSLILPPLRDEEAPADHLRYLIEKTRAEGGASGIRTALLDCSDVESGDGQGLLDVLQAYRERGIVSELGIMLAPGCELTPDSAPLIDVVAARMGDDLTGPLGEWSAAGRVTMVLAEHEDPYEVGTVMRSGVIDAVAVSPRNVRELTSLLAVV